MSRKFKFHSNRTSIKGTLHEYQYTSFIISPSVLLRMRNAVYEKMWKNTCYSRARKATDDKMTHAHCMLDTQGYKCTHTLIV